MGCGAAWIGIMVWFSVEATCCSMALAVGALNRYMMVRIRTGLKEVLRLNELSFMRVSNRKIR